MLKISVPRALVPKIAEILSRYLRPGDVVGLVGPLGAGKTTLVKKIVQKLGSKQPVTSPTFTLLQTYEATVQGQPVNIQHADLYRLETMEEVASAGLTEMFGMPNAVTFIEWADKFPKLLPDNSVLLVIQY